MHLDRREESAFFPHSLPQGREKWLYMAGMLMPLAAGEWPE
jgi:hypothetical protein